MSTMHEVNELEWMIGFEEDQLRGLYDVLDNTSLSELERFQLIDKIETISVSILVKEDRIKVLLQSTTPKKKRKSIKENQKPLLHGNVTRASGNCTSDATSEIVK